MYVNEIVLLNKRSQVHEAMKCAFPTLAELLHPRINILELQRRRKIGQGRANPSVNDRIKG
jgi:hypothetical protein